MVTAAGTSVKFRITFGGGPAALSGVTCRPLPGANGLLFEGDFADMVRPVDIHAVRTRLVCLENTHNRGGGTIHMPAAVRPISRWAKQHGIGMHLYGARIWNAIAETGIPAATWADGFDTVSVCFSKGLGAPAGSALVGPRELLVRAHRVRKMLGGGLRQAGVLAAAAQHALDHHLRRLAEDHDHARRLARGLRALPGLTVSEPQTNIVFVELSADRAAMLQARLPSAGVLVGATTVVTTGATTGAAGPAQARRLRLVTHLDISGDDVARAVVAFAAAL